VCIDETITLNVFDSRKKDSEDVSEKMVLLNYFALLDPVSTTIQKDCRSNLEGERCFTHDCVIHAVAKSWKQ